MHCRRVWGVLMCWCVLADLSLATTKIFLHWLSDLDIENHSRTFPAYRRYGFQIRIPPRESVSSSIVRHIASIYD